MKLSECRGQSFLINGEIKTYQNVLRMIYEGKMFGPITLVNIDEKSSEGLSGVMEQMEGENTRDKSLGVLHTENIEIDITREDLKPLNNNKTMFAVRDLNSILLSECVDSGFMFTCNGKTMELSDILGMIYNGLEIPDIQAVQMDTMFSHENSIAMQKLWNDGEIDHSKELSLLKRKKLTIDILPDEIEKIAGYDDMYALKEHVTEQGDLSVNNTATGWNIKSMSAGVMDIPQIKEDKAPEQTETPVDGAVYKPDYTDMNTMENKETECMQEKGNTSVNPPLRFSQPQEKKAETQGKPEELSAENKPFIRHKKNKTIKNLWKFATSWFGWMVNIAVLLGFVYIVMNYVIINAEIPSDSMNPALQTGDKIIGNRLVYALERPERGDIAIFQHPDNPSELYIMRIIGLPGETITISSGKIYINDAAEPLDESYLAEEWIEMNDGLTYEVPEDSYFMMGDNRNVSFDSRYWENKYVHKENLIAEAVLKYYPVNEITIFDSESMEENTRKSMLEESMEEVYE